MTPHSFRVRAPISAAARAGLTFEVRCPAGLEAYVFVPADLEEQKILATGVYGTNLVKVRGNYDDVNRLCTELAADPTSGSVNVTRLTAR